MPVTFVQLSRAFAKRQAISKTKVMVMPPALGEKGPGGYWDEPWSGPRSETVRVYWSWPRLVGDSEANGVWNSVGRTGLDLGRSEPWMQTASGQTQTVLGRRSVLASVSRRLGSERRWDLGRSEPQTKTVSGRRSFFVGYSFGRTALVRCSGYRSESLGRRWRWDVGDSMGRSASGRRSG